MARVPPDHLREAVATLIAAKHPADPAVDAFLAQAAVEGNDTGLMWTSTSPATPTRQVSFLVKSPGRTAVVFVSPPSGSDPPADRAARAAVIDAACGHARGHLNACIAQVLLEPEDSDLAAAYLGAGFRRLADLAYLRRDLRTLLKAAGVQSTHLPEGTALVLVPELPRSEADGLMKAALDASYEGTLDCPALCGMRTLDDVLESHKGVGKFDPTLWWVVMHGGAPHGCMLFSPVVESGTIELVYMGLSPALRGKGIASAVFASGLRALQGRPADTVACAVDLDNTPALGFYERWKFRRFATRTALVRPLA